MKWLIRALKRAFESIMEAILPLRERTRRTRLRSITDIPVSVSSEERLGWQITTLAEYRTQAVQQLIHSLKYDGNAHAAQLAAAVLAEFLMEEVFSMHAFSSRQIVIAPIPLHPKRYRERGFNQVSLVLDKLPRGFANGSMATVRHNLLRRVRATPHQTHLTREDRLSNVAGAFALRSARENLAGTHVILVDDVTTTGATLANAASVLHHAGARVSIVALARA